MLVQDEPVWDGLVHPNKSRIYVAEVHAHSGERVRSADAALLLDAMRASCYTSPSYSDSACEEDGHKPERLIEGDIDGRGAPALW